MPLCPAARSVAPERLRWEAEGAALVCVERFSVLASWLAAALPGLVVALWDPRWPAPPLVVGCWTGVHPPLLYLSQPLSVFL